MGENIVIVERDVDEDRFITYERFKMLLKEFPPLSKTQVYMLMLGITGWRPFELCRMRVHDIDPINQRIKWKIAKPKTIYKDDYIIKKHKIKWRQMPEWAFQILDKYIRKNFLTMRNGYVFPSKDSIEGNCCVGFFQEELRYKRDELYRKDPIKWSWVKEPYQLIRYPNGKTQFYYKLSLYAFRKMHLTYYAQMLQDKGISDILIHTAVHAGHSDPRTTYQYVKSLIDEKKMASGFEKAIDYALEYAYSIPKITKDQRKLSTYL